VLGLLLTIPNLVWTAHLVYTSRSYANSPQNFYEEFKNAKVKPWQYMKLFSQAGEWLMTHTEKKATIISRWKEIAFAAKGRKVAVIDAYATLEELERVIRDYNVPYIVSVVDYNGLNEFGFQMVVSKRFKFESVFRAGDVEIFQVKPKSVKDTFISPSTISDTTNYSLFKLAVYSLERSNYSKADSLLSLLWKRTDGGAPVVFYTALLREFQGKYEEANKLLQIFKSLPQAGALVEQAYFHQTIIERRIEAERETVDVLKATLYHFASMNYWELGFHQQAQEMLQRSINTKRDFFPAYVFGVFYALDEGDTLKAKKMFESLKRLSGTPAVASSFKKIFSWIDSMKSCNNQLERSRFHLQLGKEYLIIGLREMAIDQLLILLKENPNNQDGLKLLGDLYVEKRRYFPALRALDRLFALNPSNKEIALCIEALLERW
jgi:tetratricopeptide (TPR) repeat protein